MATETDKNKLPDAPPARKKKKDPLRGRAWAAAEGKPALMGWILNILVSLAIVFIVTHPRENVALEWSAHDIAPRDFKVPKDLDIPDIEGTRQKTEEAMARVRSVYDLDALVLSSIKKRAGNLFAGFRELNPPLPQPEPGDTAAPADEIITVPDAFKTEKEKELLRSLDARLEDEDLEVLRDEGFSPETEKVLLAILDSVYRKQDGGLNYVVPDKELLRKDRERGIVARALNSGPDEPPVEIEDLDAVYDLARAQEIVHRAANERLSGKGPELVRAVGDLASSLLEPNLTFNKDKTEEAKTTAQDNIKPLFYKFKKDEVIVRKGDRIQPEARKKIGIILAAQQSNIPTSLKTTGVFSVIILFNAFLYTFALRNVRKFKPDLRDLVFLAMVTVGSLAALKGVDVLGGSVQQNYQGLPEGVNFMYLVPLAGAAMLARMVLNSESALVFAMGLAAMGALVADNNLLYGVYTLAGAVAAAGDVAQCRQRSIILRAGLILGIVNAILIVFISMLGNQFLTLSSPYINPALLYNVLFGFAAGPVAAIVVTGLVPAAETVFGYATDIKLLELLNQDQPLLKELSMKSPGTHQHSLMVANLAEAAAKEVGANPLLARVCAMYHDIGKMNKPHYFAENQWDGVNVHDRLQPSMSTLIIHNHVKEGVEMAKQYKLPKVVIDGIQQHHGTSLLKFFYEKAKELNESGVPVEETDFRYPGPKPQNRETAIILLADVVEAAAKSVKEPNPARLKGMVQNLINRCFVDGQLDECDLTLKNLHDIARSFNKTLGAIYHGRPEYPQAVVKGAAEKKKKAEADAAKPKDKPPDKTKADDKKDKDDIDNTLKRLGMS